MGNAFSDRCSPVFKVLPLTNIKILYKYILNFTSVIGLEANTLSSTCALLLDLLTMAKYLIAYRADTVFPAPDSPLTIMD